MRSVGVFWPRFTVITQCITVRRDQVIQVRRYGSAYERHPRQAICEHHGSGAAQAEIEIAGQLDDLRVPPGNRFEVLKGNRAG